MADGIRQLLLLDAPQRKADETSAGMVDHPYRRLYIYEKVRVIKKRQKPESIYGTRYLITLAEASEKPATAGFLAQYL